VFDLKSGLPLMVLFRDGTDHVSYGKTLPHRPTGIGARVPYSQIELLSLGSSLGYSELNRDRKEVLLWSAALTTKRRERNDRVWFDLLSVYQRDYDSRRAYHMLSSLCRILIQLKYAEYLHDTGNYKDAFLVSRQALRTLKEAPELALRPPELDIYAPSPPALVSNYKPVLERELWLVMGNSLAYAGYFSQAELAFWGALEIDPLEWRAHDGLLRVNLGGDEARLDELLDHAQGTLTLRSWRGSSPDESMDQFFLESFITDIRSSEFYFPGSSLNWGEEPIQISSLRELLEDEP
jgi:tetratricopeptide (TPR) repeat protein